MSTYVYHLVAGNSKIFYFIKNSFVKSLFCGTLFIQGVSLSNKESLHIYRQTFKLSLTSIFTFLLGPHSVGALK